MNDCSLRGGRSSRSEVQLPYGEAPDGQLRHISDVPSGLACECVCPECHTRLVARKGQKTQHHFAHRATRLCKGAFETMLHKLAKQVLLERGKVKTPAVIAQVGQERRLLFRERMFPLTSVEEEVTLPGMRPDILARWDEHELLIEVMVTHPCDDEKLRRIREQRRAAIEIDMSKVPRHAPKVQIESAIVALADRKWLYNRHAEAAEQEIRLEQERREAEIQEGQQKAIQAEAQRLLEAWRAKPVTQPVFRPLSTIIDGGLEELVGLPIGGDACFTAPARHWQSIVLEHILVRPTWRHSQFRAADVLDILRDAKLIRPGLAGYVSDDVSLAVRQMDPSFLSPYKVVERYLEKLAELRAVVPRGKGNWSASSERADAAIKAIKAAAARRERVAMVRMALEELLDAIGQGHGINPDVWMRTRHEGLGNTPEALAENSQWAADEMEQRLVKLLDMLQKRGTVEEDLLGLPLEAAREARRQAIEAERRRYEEAERKRAEQQRLRAEEEARQQARQRRDRLIVLAADKLGYLDGRSFVEELRVDLGGNSLLEVESLTEAEEMRICMALGTEHRRLQAQLAEQAQQHRAADCKARLCKKATDAFGSADKADLWIRNCHPYLGGQRPQDVAVDEAGVARCLALLPSRKTR